MSRWLPPGAVRSVRLAADASPVVHTGMQPTQVHRYGARAAAWAAYVVLALAPLRADLAVTAPSGMPMGKAISARDLWQELERSLPNGVWVSPLENAEYQVVSARWMRRAFLPSLKTQMKAFREEKLPQENSAANCNGLALVCRLMLGLSAMEAHALAPATATVIVRQENPFGGLSATMENHCVAFVLTDEGPWIVEAQSGAYTNLGAYPNLKSIMLVSVH